MEKKYVLKDNYEGGGSGEGGHPINEFYVS